MATIKNIAGVGGHSVPTPTNYLVALWKMTNGAAATDNTLVNSASGGTDLRTRNSGNTSANFWSTNIGYGTFLSATLDFFGNPTPTEMEIGEVGVSWIFSCRIKSSAAALPTVSAAIFAKRNESSGVGNNLLISSATGVLLNQAREVGGLSQNLNGGTNVCDGAEHHVTLVTDKTGNRVIYLDGFNDDYASGQSDMTTSGLDGDMTTPTTGFMIGGASTLLDSGAINAPLFTAGVTFQVRDVHLYMKTGALPTGDSLKNIVNYLASNVYSPVPASIW